MSGNASTWEVVWGIGKGGTRSEGGEGGEWAYRANRLRMFTLSHNLANNVAEMLGRHRVRHLRVREVMESDELLLHD